MSSPYSAGRDDNVGAGNAFDQESDVSDSDLGGFMDGFACPTDQLSEQDYRDATFGGSSEPSPTPRAEPMESPQRFTYPEPQAGGRLAD